ncbi:hypothetical protein LAZ67_7001094 [Cordylochernes scorpioides]|uniref:Uncharacterized protein n=1 Tax=Cordylochernes scorpioides TaxID=51811 RepID=A0ABY6KLY8_9ARAC|nr:hypothetical protein LAZ67_7001094 [Cordylochernes scorpioides]
MLFNAVHSVIYPLQAVIENEGCHIEQGLRMCRLAVVAGQFSQMVWASSTEMGVGKARSRIGKIIVVANYWPPGNVRGHFHQNVFPPLDASPDSVLP